MKKKLKKKIANGKELSHKERPCSFMKSKKKKKTMKETMNHIAECGDLPAIRCEKQKK